MATSLKKFLFLALIPGLACAGGQYIEFKDPMLAPLLCPLTCLRDGLYVGGSLGYDSFDIRQNAEFLDGDGDLFSINPKLSAKGVAGNIFLGYGQYYGWIYIAGEISAMFSNANTGYTVSSPTSSYQTQVTVRESYTVSMLPGWRINNKSLFYGKLGYVRTAFRSQENTTGLLATATTTDQWENGLNFGAGIETLIQDNWSIRTEYSYTSYSSLMSEIGTQFIPANNEFLLSLIYHFC